MRASSVNLAVADVSQGVAAAIESEPTHEGSGQSEDRLIRILKPVAGFAVAATVALVAITSLQQPADAPVDTTSVVRAPDIAGVTAVPASYSKNERLTNYLIHHSEYSAPMGSRNVLVEIIGSEETADEDTERTIDGDEKTEE